MISIAKMHRKWNSCRRFIKTAGTAAIAAPVIMKSSISAGNEVPASDRINLGIIGCGGLGNVNLNDCAAQPGVVVVRHVMYGRTGLIQCSQSSGIPVLVILCDGKKLYLCNKNFFKYLYI
jgi:hypothetical protein